MFAVVSMCANAYLSLEIVWEVEIRGPLTFFLLHQSLILLHIFKVSFVDIVEQTDYRKFPKYSETQKICCNHTKIWTMWLYHRVMSPNDADRMTNSVNPDQTAPLGAVWSRSALFAQVYLYENLGPLRYVANSYQFIFLCR